jgi:VWFA-related protein
MDANSHPDTRPRADRHTNPAAVTLMKRTQRTLRTRRWPRSCLLISVIAVVWLVALGSASAQQPVRVEVSAARIEGSSLVVSVAVLDGASNPIRGLAASDFSAQIDTTQARIISAESSVDAALPLGIVLTVDTSGSMAGESIASARSAVSSAVQSLRAGDQAALVTFAQTVTTAVAATGDHAVLQSAIDGMKATGNTALFAAVTTAATTTSQLPQPRKAVVLLSDGEDFGNASGGITRDQALAAAKASGAPFFVVGLGGEIDQQFLSSLADVTGGQYFAAAVPAELAQLYARISERLRQQYTLTVELPAGLAAGAHQLTLARGSASARVPFNVAETPVPLKARLSEIPSELRDATVVSLVDLPAGATARFTVDGQVLKPETNGRSVRIDPYDFAPGAPHQLVVSFVPESAAASATASFMVAALPPKLLEPAEIPDLKPGELIRLTVKAQPGTTRASYLVDGVEVERDDGPPYEFVLPEKDYASGSHELKVVLSSSAAGATEAAASYPFSITATGEDTNVAGLALLAVLALAALAAVALAGRKLLQKRAERLATVPSGPPPDLSSLGTRREGIPHREAPAAAPEPGPAVPWGMLRVLEGPDKGKVFQLAAETELVGTGKFCSVRLADRELAEAHFIINSEGRLTPSAPGNAVSVNGEAVRAAQLTDHAVIRAGKTALEFVPIAAGP